MLADLGVNAGRKQREHAPPVPADGSLNAYCARRVIIDVQANGEFTIYSDPDVQVICHCAHIPEEALKRAGKGGAPLQAAIARHAESHARDSGVANIQAGGATSPRGIAGELNTRSMLTRRGGRWLSPTPRTSYG